MNFHITTKRNIDVDTREKDDRFLIESMDGV